LANIGIGAGGTTSLVTIGGTVGTTTSTAPSPVINLGVDLGTGVTGGSGGLLGGLLGGGTFGNGAGLVPDSGTGLLNTVNSLTSVLTGGGSSAPQSSPGTPGQVMTGTEGDNTITGTKGNDTLKGMGGRDVIVGNGGNDMVDGGSGLDTFLAGGPISAFNAAAQNGVLALQNKATGEIDYLMNVERIGFSDSKALAFDFNGNAGQGFRLYQAALDRAPDAGGLKFHVSAIDSGLSLHDDAQIFLNSSEFQQKYGANLSNENYVSALYNNTLHRAADAGGLAYWTNQLATNSQDRASVLIGFSESAENHNQTDQQLQNGILLDYAIA
jgi:Ca2+-binding RTX toxin-like protein